MTEARAAANQDFEFDLILSGIDELTEAVMDALFEAGCDDATVGIQGGVTSLSFTRNAPDLLAAVRSAVGDVRKADIGADVLRVDGTEHGP